MYHFYALMARMRYIGRWSLMVSHYPENVAEHSLMTAILAHALALIGRDILGKTEVDPDACVTAALFHDAPEILTGDLPTPVKYFDPDIRTAYGKVEAAGVEKLLSFLPEVMQNTYRTFLAPENEEDIVSRYVRAADKLSAYIKCKEELRAGNHEFLDAAKTSKEKLDLLNMPEITFFLEEFLPSFELTLDKLK